MAWKSRMRLFLATFGILLICGAMFFRSNADPSRSEAQEAGGKAVAVTVDDLPGAVPGTGHSQGALKDFQKINAAVPQILKAHHALAIGFVNKWKLQVAGERDARVALLQAWLDAGLTLGNHTYSLNAIPLAQYEDETIRGEVVTRALMKAAGQEERYFRYPFLMTGPTAGTKAGAADSRQRTDGGMPR